MKEISKQTNHLSVHLRIIAIPLNNIKSILGSKIECHNQSLNYILNCSRESISYFSPTQYSKAVNLISHKISATVTGRSTENDGLLEKMLRYKFVVILQNADGNSTRIGNQSKVLSFSFVYATASQSKGIKGYTISFTGDILSSQVEVILI